MTIGEETIIRYLCQELLRRAIIDEPTANAVCQKLLSPETQSLHSRKTA